VVRTPRFVGLALPAQQACYSLLSFFYGFSQQTGSDTFQLVWLSRRSASLVFSNGKHLCFLRSGALACLCDARLRHWSRTYSRRWHPPRHFLLRLEMMRASWMCRTSRLPRARLLAPDAPAEETHGGLARGALRFATSQPRSAHRGDYRVPKVCCKCFIWMLQK
jgi:hypothetical protein